MTQPKTTTPIIKCDAPDPLRGARKGSSYSPCEKGRYAAGFYAVVKTSYAMSVCADHITRKT